MAPPNSSTIRFRAARAEDSATLSRIALASKAHWDYPASWVAAWKDELTLTGDYIRQQRVALVEVNGTIAGLVALSGDGPTGEVEHLWVDPPFIGRGLGRALMEHAYQICAANGIARLEIDADPYAEAFYRHLGATPIGRTPAPMEGAPERYLPRLELILDDSR